jgi:hypothetical protein
MPPLAIARPALHRPTFEYQGWLVDFGLQAVEVLARPLSQVASRLYSIPGDRKQSPFTGASAYATMAGQLARASVANPAKQKSRRESGCCSICRSRVAKLSFLLPIAFSFRPGSSATAALTHVTPHK